MLITPEQIPHYRRSGQHTPPAPRGLLTYLYLSVYSGKWIASCSCGRLCIPDRRAQSCGCLHARSATSRRVLSPEAIADIRSSREKYKILADRWGVSTATIGSVKCGRRYGDVK